jgi:predicted RND superfamily exporter protein
MIHAIRVDGPKATLFAFFSVIVLVTILFRRLRTIGAILLSLLLGALWMVGFLLAAEWKINFLNFIAFPITFGIGVDYAVNIFSRWTLEGRTRISKVIGSTGGAVGLASYTTIIGYGSLLIASNQAFVSFGKLAVLGEFTCLGAAIFTLPAILRLREIQREKRMAQIEARYRAAV